MRKLGRLLLLAAADCARRPDLGRLRRRQQQQRRRQQRRYGHSSDGYRAGLPRPPREYTTQGAEADLDQLHAPGHLQARELAGRQRGHSGPRHGPAADLVRPEDLHPHPAQGPRVLERPARQGERLQVHGRAHDQGQLGRQELRHRQRRRRDRLRRGQGNDITGITTDDATGKITIQLEKPYGAFTNVLAFPELGSGSVRHARSHDHAGPNASGRRALHDHGHRSEQVVQRRQEPEVRGPEHPGHPDGSPRPDQRDDPVEHPDRGPGGPQQPGGQLRRR